MGRSPLKDAVEDFKVRSGPWLARRDRREDAEECLPEHKCLPEGRPCRGRPLASLGEKRAGAPPGDQSGLLRPSDEVPIAQQEIARWPSRARVDCVAEVEAAA